MTGLVRKPETILPLGPVDISALVPLVERLSERVWDMEDSLKENDFFCFHSTRHLVFRFTPGNAHPDQYYSNPSWAAWQSKLLPIIEKAIESYGFRAPAFPKVMLARLEAGKHIDRHRDGAGSNLRTHKIHVPLVTNPGAIFEAGGHSMHLELGHAYEVNNVGYHSAKNDGGADRIHLIFEVYETDVMAEIQEAS